MKWNMPAVARRVAIGLCALAGISVFAGPALAAAYPDKPITMLVGFRAGGGVDTVGRLIARHMEQTFGQPVVATAKAGAGGGVLAAALAKAKPDGYTIGIAVTSTWSFNPVFAKKKRYGVDDATLLASIARAQCAIFVAAKSPYKSLQDAFAAAKGGEALSASSPAPPATFLLRHLAGRNGVKLRVVNVKGTPAVIQQILGGHVDLGWSGGHHIPYLRKGEVRVIAATDDRRLNAPSKDVPTLKEMGYKISFCGAYIMAAPKGLPGDVKSRLDAALKAAIGSEPVQTFIERRKLAGNYQGSEALTAEVRAEAAAWAKVKAGLKK
ncbi:MAG: tripartite tricarboxylate transporter substrate binding protein [Defluviicoccus sp.]|nr:tripartite tricarboxylate transporter substrate binding protein [Defluviicoccus sp.]